MNKIYLVLLLLIIQSCAHKEDRTFEVIYSNGDKEIFSTEHYVYPDNSFTELELINGCILVHYNQSICNVRSFKYIN